MKKGAKAVAFALGGVFVLLQVSAGWPQSIAAANVPRTWLQYLGSMSIVRVDWGRAASRFENLFYTRDTAGVKRAPTVGSLFRWIVDFLTADFQPRATFIAGFALGLRIG